MTRQITTVRIFIKSRFLFQAEVGIRDYKVTGVQTCALPISFASRWRCVEPSRGGAIRYRFGVVIPYLLEVRIGITRTWPRKDPVEIWMRKRTDVAAAGALLTRGILIRAEQALREPERKPLLADTAGPVKEQAGGECAGLDALGKPLAQRCVSVDVGEAHSPIWRRRPESGTLSVEFRWLDQRQRNGVSHAESAQGPHSRLSRHRWCRGGGAHRTVERPQAGRSGSKTSFRQGGRDPGDESPREGEFVPGRSGCRGRERAGLRRAGPAGWRREPGQAENERHRGGIRARVHGGR